MRLTPRYGNDPVITLDGSPADIAEPAIRQRRRLAAALADLSPEQWTHPSRCEGWSNRDVVVHLDSTNTFWAFSVSAGLRGEPTRFLATFDPVASPAELVAGSSEVSTSEALDRFVASTDSFVDLLGSLDEAGWTALAEAPPGHLSVSAVVHHALWDSWVHERDILGPLGAASDEEADEVAACLRYAAALGPALAVTRGADRAGTLAVDVTEPELAVVVEVADRVVVRAGTADADLCLTGDAVALLEALSMRTPLDQAIPHESSWMLRGLSETFAVEQR